MSWGARMMSMPCWPIVSGSSTLRLLLAMDMDSSQSEFSLQVREIAAIMRGRQVYLVHHHVLQQSGDVADQIAAIRRLRHLRAHLRPDRVGPLIQDGCRLLARQKHRGANDVDAFFHVQSVTHRDDAMLRRDINRTADAADETTGHRRGMNDLSVLL